MFRFSVQAQGVNRRVLEKPEFVFGIGIAPRSEILHRAPSRQVLNQA
jgi:hypothetical protein